MEFRGIRRVNKPQSGLFSSHYYNSSFFNCQSEEKTVPFTILSDSKNAVGHSEGLVARSFVAWYNKVRKTGICHPD